VTAPLEISVDVACTVEHAFDVWTRRIGTWWPADHTATGEAGLDVILEPRVGGRIYQRDPAGSEIDWGEVTLWEPPSRLGYLWHLRRDRADATSVLITFRETGPGRTTVDIRHDGWDRLGAAGPQWRDANRAGWGSLLPWFVQAAGDAAPPPR